MIKPIMRDVLFLGMRSEPAAKDDLPVGEDLRDTLRAHASACVGMAANMIGVRKRIIAARLGGVDTVMYNPVIVKKDTPYETEEGCLSLDGVRRTVRYRSIEVEYLDGGWKKRRLRLTGFAAQIVQHEIDHINGIVI